MGPASVPTRSSANVMAISVKALESVTNPSQKTEFEQTKYVFRKNDIREVARLGLQTASPKGSGPNNPKEV